MIRRALTSVLFAAAAVYGAAVGREVARCVRLELDHRRRPP